MNSPSLSPNPSPSPLHAALARAAAAWQACSARERQLIGIAAVVLAVGSALALADWAGSERQRLARSLPRAEAQLEATQEAATEITALHAKSVAPPLAGAALIDSVVTSAKSRGLAVTVQAAGEGLHLRGSGDFDTLLAWLATLHNDQGLRIVRIEVQRTGGEAGIDAILAGPAAP